MAMKSGFFNSIHNDRPYSADDFSSFFDGVFSDGIFRNYGDCFKVTPRKGIPKAIQIGTGKAWFNNTWSLLENPEYMTFTDSIDHTATIILHINKSISIRSNSLDIKMDEKIDEINRIDDDEWLIPIAFVSIKATAAKIEESDIINLVGTEACPYAKGILESEEILNGWANEFGKWFESIKNQLSSDAAGKLQLQIDKLSVLHSGTGIDLSEGRFEPYNSDQTPMLTKIGNVVQLTGAIKNKDLLLATGEPLAYYIGSVPEGFRPVTTQRIVEQGSMQYRFLLTIQPNGWMYIERYANGNSWAEIKQGSWLNLTATWITNDGDN